MKYHDCGSKPESISNRGLANEVNGLSFLCPRWKSLKQRMQMGLPILGQGRTVRISPRFEMLCVMVRRNSPAGFPQLFLLDPDRNIIEINGAPQL